MTDPRNRKQYGGAKPHRAQKSSARTGVAGAGLLHGRPGQFGKVGRHDGRIAAAGLDFGNRAVDRLQDFSLPGMILGHRGVQPADGVSRCEICSDWVSFSLSMGTVPPVRLRSKRPPRVRPPRRGNRLRSWAAAV